ncbi:MAG: endolytic transglycosylase MltG [Microthrixaceae bacterium]|nr:endolytic transglycosylase MltG [Microthrixaceae bacterium]
MSDIADDWETTALGEGWIDSPVIVYQNPDGSFTDEADNEVFDDGAGGFVYADGTAVLVADPDHPSEAVDPPGEILVYEDGAGGYVDERGEPVFDDGAGGWMDRDGLPLSQGWDDLVAAPMEVAPSTPKRRGGKQRYEDLATNDGCGRRAIVGFLVVLGVVMLVGAGAVFWVLRKVDPPGEPGETVNVVIPDGATDADVGQLLEAEGVITDAGVFGWYVRFTGGNWAAGEYPGLQRNSSFAEVTQELDDGPVAVGTSRVTIPEGVELDEALDLLAAEFPDVTKDDLYAALGSGAVTSKYVPAELPPLDEGEVAPAKLNKWEGMLFPDTYEFSDDATPESILQKLADQMTAELDELGYENAPAKVGRTPYETVIVASLVEEETGTPPEERSQIARVIYNRLEAPEILGIDATAVYSKGKAGSELTTDELRDPADPFNTRSKQGLPPTPIALPSQASLKAAIAPEQGSWLYYVLTEPGVHSFFETKAEFDAAVAEARANGVIG